MHRAEQIVAALLDHCGHCSDRDKRLKIGIGVEAEHTNDSKEKRKIALTHMGENPDYYPAKPKPKNAKEALRWVKDSIETDPRKIAQAGEKLWQTRLNQPKGITAEVARRQRERLKQQVRLKQQSMVPPAGFQPATS
jgi:hypothetical protein